MPGFLELSAMLVTVWCILLAVKRNIWTYPVGIVGTILYYFVLLPISLPLALLQVVFTIDQLYGWWFWARGDKGKVPRIKSVGLVSQTLWQIGVFAVCYYVGTYLGKAHPKLMMGGVDTGIFGVSLLAQFFLDRKWIENWIIWIVVNALSVWYYYTVGLYATSVLSIVLFFNAFWGYSQWSRELRGYEANANDSNFEAIGAV